MRLTDKALENYKLVITPSTGEGGEGQGGGMTRAVIELSSDISFMLPELSRSIESSSYYPAANYLAFKFEEFIVVVEKNKINVFNIEDETKLGAFLDWFKKTKSKANKTLEIQEYGVANEVKNALKGYRMTFFPDRGGGEGRGGGAARAVVKLKGNIGPAMPFLSRQIKGVCYNPDVPLAAFNLRGMPVVISAREINIYNPENKAVARKVIAWLKKILSKSDGI